MAKYTFVTESHLSGDDKQEVEILSRRDVEKIAEKSTEQGFGLLRREWESERDRLSKRIDRAAQTANEAERVATEAQKTAETTGNRLVEESGNVFREIVGKSLQPILDSGLKQVLDTQKNIQEGHKTLKGDVRGLRADFDAARQAAETHLSDLTEENQRLRDDMNRFRTDTAKRQEGKGIEQVDSSEEIRKLRSEVETLRDRVDELRSPGGEALVALEAKLKNMRAELSKLRGKIATVQSDTSPAPENKNTALWVVAVLALLLALGGLSGGCPSTPSSPVASVPVRGKTAGETSTVLQHPQPGQDGESAGESVPSVLLLLARVGDDKAQICLGKMHLEGLSVGDTDEESVLWVRRAAHNDKTLHQQAMAWLQNAASQGNISAKEFLVSLQKKKEQTKMQAEAGAVLPHPAQ